MAKSPKIEPLTLAYSRVLRLKRTQDQQQSRGCLRQCSIWWENRNSTDFISENGAKLHVSALYGLFRKTGRAQRTFG